MPAWKVPSTSPSFARSFANRAVTKVRRPDIGSVKANSVGLTANRKVCGLVSQIPVKQRNLQRVQMCSRIQPRRLHLPSGLASGPFVLALR